MTDHGRYEWEENREAKDAQAAADKLGIPVEEWRELQQHNERMARARRLRDVKRQEGADLAYLAKHEHDS